MNRTLTATISKTPTDGSGRFEAIAYDSAAPDTDNVKLTVAGIDSAVEKFNARGRPLVLRWAHRMDHPDDAIGTITRVWRHGTKLMISGQLDLKHDLAQRAYEALLAGRLNELSIGWVETEAGTTVRDGVRFMSDIDLLEVSLVPAGANRGTRVTAVKRAQTGRPHIDRVRAALRSEDFVGYVRDVREEEQRRDLVESIGYPSVVAAKRRIRSVVDARRESSPEARRAADVLIARTRAEVRRQKAANEFVTSYPASRRGRDPDQLVLDAKHRPLVDESVVAERQTVPTHIGARVKGGCSVERSEPPAVRPETVRVGWSAHTPVADAKGANAELRYAVEDDLREIPPETVRMRVR